LSTKVANTTATLTTMKN